MDKLKPASEVMAGNLDSILSKRRKDVQIENAQPAPQLSPEEIERQKTIAEKRDLFTRRYVSLKEALPFVRQPDGKTFGAYETTCPEQVRAVEICKRFTGRLMDRIVDQKNSMAGILLVGDPGTGKTHLASAILGGLKLFKMPGFFIKAVEFFDVNQPSFASQLDRPMWKVRDLLAGVSCLVIDDVGMQSWTDAERKRLTQILEMRGDAGLPTVITTNVSKDELEKLGGARLASRFDDHLYPIVCTWADRRKELALVKQDPFELF